MDSLQPLSLQPVDRVVTGHPPLRHGLRRHPLREGRADLLRGAQLPEVGDPRVSGPDPLVSPDPAPGPHRPGPGAGPPLAAPRLRLRCERADDVRVLRLRGQVQHIL